MVEVPGAIADNSPVEGFIVATLELLLVHVPPAVASTKVVEVPLHNDVLPRIVPTVGSIVITSDAILVPQ